jgi:hypothetical protein
MSVGFASSNISSTNLYTLDTTYNLSVPGPSNVGGTVPNVTNLGAIVTGGSERGLCLQHATSSTATVNAAGTPDRGQKLVITFPRNVSNLTFWLVDIDGPTTGYWDRVRFTITPALLQKDTMIQGTGAATSAFQYGTSATDSNANNLGENAAGGRVRVRFPGPLMQLEMQYWNISGTGVQRLFLHNLEFDAIGC